MKDKYTVLSVYFLFVCVFMFLKISDASAIDEKNEGEKKEIFTLEDCIKMGLEGYQEVKIAQYNQLASEQQLSEAKTARYLPKFSMTGLFGPVPNVPAGFGPPDFANYEYDWSKWNIFLRLRIEAIQPIYTFGKLSGYIDAASSGVKAKELEIEVQKRELIYKIKQIYYGITLGYAGLSLMDEMKDTLESAKKKIKTLLKKGSSDVTDLDLLKLKVTDADLKRRYIDAHSQIAMGKRALKVLMGLKPSNNFEIADKRLKKIEYKIRPIEEYLNLTMQDRAELKQMNSVVKVRKALLQAEKSNFYPSIFIAGQFDYGVAPGRESYNNPYINDRFNVLSGGAALGLSQNLNFFLTNTKYKKAKIEYKKALSQLELVKNAVLLEVEKSYEDLTSKEKTIEITKSGFKDGRSWLSSSYLGFDMGTISTSDLIQSFVAYTKTKMDYFEAVFNFNQTLAKLSQSTGQELANLKY